MKRKNVLNKYAVVMIVAVLILTVFSVFFVAIPNQTLQKENTPNVQKNTDTSVNDIVSDVGGISQTLEKEIKSIPKNEKTWVYVLTDNITKLGAELRSVGIKTDIGTVTYKLQLKSPIRTVILRLTPQQIVQVSKLDAVVKVFSHPSAEVQALPQDRLSLLAGNTGNVLNTQAFAVRGEYQTLHHGAQDAWALGFNGTNVTIAIIDTGVDFAHPDLYGSWAVDTDPNSSYYGWPIVYDSWSMYLYEIYNVTGMDAYYKYGLPSWYVNTSYNTTALPNGTVYFNGHYYNVSGIYSASGHYHLGLLPATYYYMNVYGNVPAVLLVDSKTPYHYDTVYVDLDMDYDFTDEKPTNKTSPVAYRDDYNASNNTRVDSWNGGDGYPDWSGGMIYFIADGKTPLPGSNLFTWWYGVPNRIPGNGNLVAFEGDYDSWPHGTACAANAVSRGITAGGIGIGMAPSAKIMAIPHFWFDGVTEWLFAELGYNMEFNDTDSANIASNSWGDSYIAWDGWDTTEDRMLDWVAEVFPQINFVIPRTSFLVALGNGGPGYGTATSPAVQAAINVGAGTEWGYRQIFFGDSKLYDSYYGDVADFSARGPFANGKTTPDILATGEFGITPYALDYYASFGGIGNGAYHLGLFSGTSMATPVTAGGLALIYQAYYKAHNTYPDIWTAKSLIQSSADDHNYDPLSQGPGWLNVLRGVKMAAEMSGVSVSPNVWNVGEYNNREYPMFAGVVYPGQTLTKTFRFQNHNSSNIVSLTLSGVTYVKSYEYNITIPGDNKTTSVYWLNLSNLSTPIPYNTDLLQIITYTNYTYLDSPNDTQHANPNINYMVGFLWDYINYTSITNYTDRMRMQTSACQGNVMDVMIHDPMRRLHGDMWYELYVSKIKNITIPFHIKIVGYTASTWNWLTLSSVTVTVPAGGTAPVVATISVPATAQPGIYEGKILINDGVNVSSIPVVVYVAAQINSRADVINMGGQPLSSQNTYLYENSHVRGLYDWGWRAETGDWRFYFINVNDSVNITNSYLTVEVTWESNLTDIDAYILENSTDYFSTYYQNIYGPYTLSVKGQSKNTYISGGKYAWETSSGGPKEVISAPLQNGLLEIMIHNVLYGGINASEQFKIRVYITTYYPNNFTAYVGDKIGLSGTQPVKFSLGVNSTGLDINVTPMVYVQRYNNIPITTGKYNYYLLHSVNWTYLGVKTYCSGDIDLYLLYSSDGTNYSFYTYSATPSGDESVSVPNPADGYWLVIIYGYSVPANTTYDIEFYKGFPNLPQLVVTDVPTNIIAGVQYTFNITYNFSGYNIPAGKYISTVYFGPAGSGNVYSVNATIYALDQRPVELQDIEPVGVINNRQPLIKVAWNETGIYTGLKNFTVFIDGVKITPLRVWNDSQYIYAYVPFLLADGVHEAKVYAEDYAGNGNTTVWNFTVDATPPSLTIISPAGRNVPLTYNGTLWINGTTDPNATVTINNVTVAVDSSGSFSYRATLVEGQNIFYVTASDSAGNTVTEVVTALYLPQLPELWDNITKIKATIANLENRISILESEVSNLSAQVNDLQTQLNNLQLELQELNKSLEENVTMLNEAIKQTRVDLINDIQNNVTAINNRMDNISAQIDAIDTEISAIKTKNTQQDKEISSNQLLGYAGIGLGIIALILALLALMRKPKEVSTASIPESRPEEQIPSNDTEEIVEPSTSEDSEENSSS